MRKKVLFISVVVATTFACWSFDDAREAHCAKPGAFCFDGGATQDDGGLPSDDGGLGDAGAPDAGDPGPDAGEDGGTDAGTPALSATRAYALGGIYDPQGLSVALPQTTRMLIAGGHDRQTMLLESSLSVPAQVDGFVLIAPPDAQTSSAITMSNNSDDYINDVASAPSGAIYFGGTYWDQSSSVISGAGTSVSLPVGAGGRRLFVARLEPDGTPAWATRIDGPASTNFDHISLAATETQVVAAGPYIGAPTVNGRSLPAPDGENSLVVAFEPDGGHRWHTTFDCDDSGGVTDVARVEDLAASSVAVAVAGYTHGKCYVTPPDPLQRSEISNGTPRAVLVVLSNAGTITGGPFRPSHDVTSSASRFTTVDIAPAGEVVAAGSFTGSLIFGGVPVDSPQPAAMIVVYEGSGTVRWVRTIEPSGGGTVSDPVVAAGVGGDFYVAGGFSRTVRVEPLSTVVGDAAVEGTRGYLLRFSSTGDLVSVNVFGAQEGITRVTSLDVGPSGEVILAGFTSHTFSVNGRTVAAPEDGGVTGYTLLFGAPAGG